MIGDVPVEEDGSVRFTVPAGKLIYFQAIDENGLAVQLMLKGFAFSFSARPPERTPTKTTPGRFGARASKLNQMLSKGHHDVKLTPDELNRITLWLDCNSNFYGAYHDLEKQIKGEVVLPTID